MNEINKTTKNILRKLKSACLQRSYKGLNSDKILFIHCNLSRVCPPTNMASETVKRSLVAYITCNIYHRQIHAPILKLSTLGIRRSAKYPGRNLRSFTKPCNYIFGNKYFYSKKRYQCCVPKKIWFIVSVSPLSHL